MTKYPNAWSTFQNGKAVCRSCGKRTGVTPLASCKFYDKHLLSRRLKTKADAKHNRNQKKLLHRKAVSFLGGKCVKCGIDDLRVLQINHLRSRPPATERLRNRYVRFLKSILAGRTNGLEIRCANCNVLYEYEVGRKIW